METITQSMLGMFLRCPHQFERRYLRGEIIPPGIAARRGSATHKAAQINHEQKLHSQEDLPVGDLQDAARDHYVRLITGRRGLHSQRPDSRERHPPGQGPGRRHPTHQALPGLLSPGHPALPGGREDDPGCRPGLAPPGHHRRPHGRPLAPGPQDRRQEQGAQGGGPLPAAHLLCRPSGPPDGEVAGKGEPGNLGEQQRTKIAKPTHHRGGRRIGPTSY